MEQQTMTGSGLYILIAVQLLFSMLILLRIRQYRKKPTGCLPAVLVILSTAVFTSVLYYIWQIVCDENSCWTDLGGMLAAGSWQEWVAWAFFGLFVVLFTAAGCSLFGFALTGHHPKFCKEMWRSLIGMMLIPIPYTRPAGCIHAVHQPFRDDTFHLAVFRSRVQRRGDAGTECCPVHLRIYGTSGLPVQVQRQ